MVFFVFIILKFYHLIHIEEGIINNDSKYISGDWEEGTANGVK